MTELIVQTDGGVDQFTEQGATLIRRMLCPEASNEELAFFATYCKRLNLDPLAGHVHLVKRRQQRDGQWIDVARPELSLSALLLLAERSGKYAGRTQYEWCGKDGQWRDVWLEDTPPAASRVGVYRTGSPEPIYGVATFASYAARKRNGELMAMWEKHGPRMIAKCALALALREALPAELGGVYSVDEMQHAPEIEPASNDVVDVEGEEVEDEPEASEHELAIASLIDRAKQLPSPIATQLREQMQREQIPARGMTPDQLVRVTTWLEAAEDQADAEGAA